MIATWPELAQLIALNGPNVLLFGPPGTGKTTIATSADCYCLTMTQDTPAAELRGHYIPSGNGFTWHHGPAVRAWLEGKRLVINEIDQASGDALNILNVILDDRRSARLTLPTGETVRPIEGFSAVATMNGTPADLPVSLADRFSIRVCVDAPHPDAIADLTLRQSVIDTIDLDPERKISTRQARMFDHLAAVLGGNRDLAARCIFGDRAADILNAIALSPKVAD